MFQPLVRMAFPTSCPGCGRNASGLCRACRETVVPIRSQGCFYCGRLSPFGKLCPACRKKSSLTGVFIAAYYESPLKEAIWQFKYGGARHLAGSLAPLLSPALLNGRPQAVTTVPLHRRREWWRGFNQAELLVAALGSSLPYSAVLRRTRHGNPQVELSRKARLENVRGAFEVTATPPSRLLLVDDVATTGATLEDCAQALRQAGTREVWAAVLARHK